MPPTNSYTFDASTGELTLDIQLEKHKSLQTLQLGTEEHNGKKGWVKACPHNPPRNVDQTTLRLRSGDIENGRLVESKDQHSVLLHVVNSHKVKPRKNSERHVTIIGDRSVAVKIRHGHAVTVHNSNCKWVLSVPKNTQKVEFAPA